MARAAVRDIVASRLEAAVNCPPGHRFSVYFPIWSRDWKIEANDKTPAAKASCGLGSALPVLKALRDRQAAMAIRLDMANHLVIETVSTAAFATGLGGEHPTENGFAFLSPYGLPYLAGSGVKGVLRRAAEELAADDADALPQAVVDALFGPEHGEKDSTAEARRGALSCWDVLPLPAGNKLVPEVMTPHFGDYYQKGGTPHDAGSPNPITFLAVPAGSEFRFVLSFDPARVPPAALAAVGDWKQTVRRIALHAFEWLGFGAKTAVGYGAMQENQRATENLAVRAQEIAREQAIAAMSPNLQQIEAFRARAEKTHAEYRGQLRPVSDSFMGVATGFARMVEESGDWSPEDKAAAAAVLEEWVGKIIRIDPKDMRKRLGLNRLRGIH
jgi:CRISPR-associated protein Cmr6